MVSLKQLERDVKKIKARNKKVEGNKAWEVSYSRRIILFVFTYLAIGIYMLVINVPDPWLNAIVPAFAFALSTLTLPFFKKIWLNYFYKSS